MLSKSLFNASVLERVQRYIVLKKWYKPVMIKGRKDFANVIAYYYMKWYAHVIASTNNAFISVYLGKFSDSSEYESIVRLVEEWQLNIIRLSLPGLMDEIVHEIYDYVGPDPLSFERDDFYFKPRVSVAYMRAHIDPLLWSNGRYIGVHASIQAEFYEIHVLDNEIPKKTAPPPSHPRRIVRRRDKPIKQFKRPIARSFRYLR